MFQLILNGNEIRPIREKWEHIGNIQINIGKYFVYPYNNQKYAEV